MTDEPKQIDDGGPSFPWESFTGMSLRDYFAGMALSNHRFWQNGREPLNECAADCYAIADAMLKARKEDA